MPIEFRMKSGRIGEFMEVHLEDRLGMNLSRNYSMMRVASGFLKDNCFSCINV